MNHLRVLEYSNSIAAAWCGQQFAQWGADVIVLGSGAASMLHGEPRTREGGDTFSLLWENLHRRKRLQNPETMSDELWQQADVIITDQPFADLNIQKPPGTITVDVTPFGRTGPYSTTAATELTIEAASGYLSLNGSMGRAPLRAPGHLIGYYCGVSAFVAALAAINYRHRTGVGESVDVSWLESVANMVPFVRAQYTGSAEVREGGPSSGVRLFPVGDGYLSINLRSQPAFDRLLHLLGIDPTSVPESIATPQQRVDDRAVADFLRQHAKGASAQDVYRAFNESSSQPVGLFSTPGQLLDDEHLTKTGYFRDHPHPQLGDLAVNGPPGSISGLADARSTAAPTKARSDLRWHPRATPPSAPGHPETNDMSSARPLEGIRIVDLTQAWIGPFATQLLADLGADVIKVESLKRPDVWRGARSADEQAGVTNPLAHPLNACGRFNGANTNKRGLCLDLTTVEGRDIVLELVRSADIVIDNFTPRVMSKFGLEYAVLQKVNSRIIAVSCSGYGKTGPYASYRANGTTVEAMAGWDALFSRPREEPMVMGYYQADAITGMHLAATTLVALHQRDITGEGQSVSASMIEAAVTYVGEEILAASLGRDSERYGNRHPDMVLQGVYPCLGNDKWVVISIRDENEWRKFRAIVALPGRTYDTPEDRDQNEEHLDGAVSAWTGVLEPREVVERLRESGIPVSEVLDILDVLDHPQLVARKWFVPVDHPDLRTCLHGGDPWRFSRSRLSSRQPAPRIGEHSMEILSQDLGMPRDAIDALVEAGVTGQLLTRPVGGGQKPVS